VGQWTTFTPDGRRLVISRSTNGWRVACGDDPPVSGDRLEVVLIEAMLFSNGFVLHQSGVDRTRWAWGLADEIEQGKLPPDDD